MTIQRKGQTSGRRIREDGTYINTADYLFNQTDAFGKGATKNYKSLANIGSQYNHSPERHRLYINGSRFQLQYGTTTKFEDKVDSYTLKPAAGDTMEYRTAERFRYTPDFVIEASTAFGVNQSLQGDDKIVMGYGFPDIVNNMANANGWFREWRGGEGDNTCFLTTYRDGTELTSSTKQVSLHNAITDWQRIEDQINWYNVGNRIARETYTTNGEQFNPIVGQTSVDGTKGPTTANLPFVLAVQTDASTTGLELDCGSTSISLIGNVEPVFRVKESIVTASHTGGGQFEALFAIRKDPDNENVFINITDVQIAQVSTDDDVEIIAIGVDPSKTDASGFATPLYHSSTNSALQETTSVTTFPNVSGTTVTSATDFGGFQLGFAAYFTAGTGTSNRRTTQARGVRKRAISNGDYVVFLAKTSSAMDITVNYETEQEY